ncbi:MAG TPA: hypothetical protein VN803_06830 [Gemmatimonadales bacterium]|nr:hypothetical protein [Gemmatimonadales bacterium]
MKRYVIGIVLALALGGVAFAQEKKDDAPKAPALTEVQKLHVQNLAQRLELAQTQIRAAQLEYERTAQTLTQLVQALQVPGYDLNLQALEYAKKPELGKAPEKKEDPPK